MTSRSTATIPVASRISGFAYAIRNIVAEARKVEASGRKVRYLNIGDPIIFGFKTPPHMVEAVERAMRDGHNGYAPSAGISPAREAVAAECARRGMPVAPDRVLVTAGTSEGIELALTTLAGPGDDVLVPVPTYPLYTAVLAKIGARPVFYGTHPSQRWVPDVQEIRRLITRTTRALVVIDPNNPTGASYPPDVRRGLLEIADEHNIPLLADEVYADLAFDKPVDAIASLNPDAPVITFSSLSKAYLAPGWRTGWLAVGRTDRLDDVLAGIKKLADGRLCSTAPMETCDRCRTRRRSQSSADVPECVARTSRSDDQAPQRRRRDVRRCARGGVLRDAAGRAATGRDRRRVRARAAAGDGGVVRVRLRVRNQTGGRILPRRVSRVTSRTDRDLRSHRRFHSSIPVGPTLTLER